MSTQRYISTSFWDDEWIQSLDPSEKLLYLYYMTNPLTNIAGVYKITERRVSFDTGFNISTIQHIMQKFDKSGKVFRHGEWVVLPTWAKHQKVSERDNNRKGIDAILKSLPDDVFSFIVEKGYKYIYLNEIGRPLQGASKTLNYSDIELELESNLDTNTQECAREEIPKPKESEPPRPDFNTALHPEIKAPVINWQDLYTAWMKTPGTADPGVFRFCQITARKLIPLFSGLTSEQVFKAVENFQDMLSRPTWWTTTPSIVTWAEKHIDRFLPGNYNPEEYRKEETAQEANARYVKEAMEKLNANNG